MFKGKKIIVVMPAYNAGKKIVFVFERVPEEIWKRNVSFIIVNDGSTDDTAKKILEIKSRWGSVISSIDKPKNEGYARAQKSGFAWALQEGADIVVVLHSDGQCAPEVLPELLRPLEEERADMVQGSRMMNRRDAIAGGMPKYKFIANVVLSTVENWVFWLNFAEYHSGYMLYSRKALETIPFVKLSDTFHFDGEMLLVGAKKGLRVKQMPVPTLYADEVSHVKGIRYGLNIIKIMIKYLLGRYDFPDAHTSPHLSHRYGGTSSAAKDNNRATLLFSAVVGALALLTITFGYTGYSLHGFQDSMGTMPPSISYALGNGFKDQLSTLRNSWGDPTGQGRYLWYPPLFSLVISMFVRPSVPMPPPQQAFLGAGIIAAIAVLLAAFVYYKIATFNGKTFGFLSAALICGFLAIALRDTWYFMARCEPFESALLMLGFVMAIYFKRLPWLILGFAVLLGLLVATQPFGTLLFIFAAGLFFSFFYEWRRSLLYMSIMCLLGLLTFILAMQLSPYGIVETLTGIWRHGGHEVERLDSSLLFLGFLKSSYAILYGIMMAFTAFFSVGFYKHFRDQIKAPFLFMLFSALILVSVFYFIVWGAKTYYALVFSFFIFSAFVYYLTHIVKTQSIKYGAVLFVLLFAAYSLKPAFAFPSYLQNGVAIPEARKDFGLVLARHPNTDIFLGFDLWVLTENYTRIHGLGDITPEQLDRRPLVLLLHQAYSYGDYSPGPTPPTEMNGCPLEENYFASQIPTFLGIKVSNVMPGYGFATYVCK